MIIMYIIKYNCHKPDNYICKHKRKDQDQRLNKRMRRRVEQKHRNKHKNKRKHERKTEP